MPRRHGSIHREGNRNDKTRLRAARVSPAMLELVGGAADRGRDVFGRLHTGYEEPWNSGRSPFDIPTAKASLAEKGWDVDQLSLTPSGLFELDYRDNIDFKNGYHNPDLLPSIVQREISEINDGTIDPTYKYFEPSSPGRNGFDRAAQLAEWEQGQSQQAAYEQGMSIAQRETDQGLSQDPEYAIGLAMQPTEQQQAVSPLDQPPGIEYGLGPSAPDERADLNLGPSAGPSIIEADLQPDLDGTERETETV